MQSKLVKVHDLKLHAGQIRTQAFPTLQQLMTGAMQFLTTHFSSSKFAQKVS
jgi:hypothetical protein